MQPVPARATTSDAQDALAPGVVLVVQVPLDRDAEFVRAAAGLLDDAELARARRFLLPDVARRFIVSHAALRAVLARHIGGAARQVCFVEGAAGKPELAGRAGDPSVRPRFNLSHAGDLAAIALTCGREVGIDVEALRPLPEIERLAARILSPREAAALGALPVPERVPPLLRCWTRKEALLKAVGCGLRAVPLPSVDIGIGPLPAAGLLVRDPRGNGAPWRVHDLDAPRGWVGALAVEAGDGSPTRLLAATCPPLR